MPLDGLRAWIGEVERKLGMRTRVFLVLAAIAIGGAGAAIYLALDARDTAVSESDVQALQEDLEAQISGGGAATGTDLSTLETELRELEAKVERLEGGTGGAESGATGAGTGGAAAPGASLPDPAGGASEDSEAADASAAKERLQDVLDAAEREDEAVDAGSGNAGG
jgi:hypothetical protein